MNRFSVGDRVRVDIPDVTDPDHNQYHGAPGRIEEVHNDDAGQVTGDERDSTIYVVQLDTGETVNFRWRDLRPF